MTDLDRPEASRSRLAQVRPTNLHVWQQILQTQIFQALEDDVRS